MFETNQKLYASDKGFGEKFGQVVSGQRGSAQIQWGGIDRPLTYLPQDLAALKANGVEVLGWKATRVGTGTRYSTAKGRVVVQRASWTRPGFNRRNGQATGWVVYVDGEQLGPAHPTATKAKENAFLPGVWDRITKALS